MGVGCEDIVVVAVSERPAEPSVITVNCPDKTGLSCDICRTIFEFGLCITRGDISTDGNWCYMVFWVVQRYSLKSIPWSSLKERLLVSCPSPSLLAIPYYYDLGNGPPAPQFYLLKLFSSDRKGLLHDVTQVLYELELILHRVKVSTTPDGRVMYLFFITDAREQLHTRSRQEETSERLRAVLGVSCISCELQLAEDFQHGFSSLPPAVAEELFRPEPPESEIHLQALIPDRMKQKTANVTIDNSLSPAHTLLQLHCVDRKGLLYDILRALKDCNIQMSYGRFMLDNKGYREIDLLVVHDGKKIVDPEKKDALRSRLRLEMFHSLRVIVVNRGPDTELLVANPVELCGKGRPRVFYDVILALKMLGICIFLAEIGRHTTAEGQWEVYRFLLDENCGFPVANSKARDQIVDKVRRTPMGW